MKRWTQYRTLSDNDLALCLMAPHAACAAALPDGAQEGTCCHPKSFAACRSSLVKDWLSAGADRSSLVKDWLSAGAVLRGFVLADAV